MSTDSTSFGDRMKLYEMAEAGRMLMPLLPGIARIDGRCFSNFTRGLERPYDKRLSNLMVETTKYLVEETCACMGYTQSDEISLAWYSDDIKSEIFFGGRIQKMVSQLAALATVFFNRHLTDHFYFPNGFPEWDDKADMRNKMPTFDARVWNVPTLEEGANVFLWREQDATRNSIQMASQALYSHKELFGKDTRSMMEMLFAKNVNWNDYPAFFKRGTYVQRKKRVGKFTTEELENLPPKHQARFNPDLEVERSEYVVLDMPPLGKVTNRAGVIFRGEEPYVMANGTNV